MHVYFGITPDAPRREENYMLRKEKFREHAFDMADTAVALAKSGAVTDKEHADQLVKTAKKVLNESTDLYIVIGFNNETHHTFIFDSIDNCASTPSYSCIKGHV